LETIIQAGMNKMSVETVPIHPNPETRKSRLCKSTWAYIKRSALVIIRSFLMYRPFKFLGTLGATFFVIGFCISFRYLILLLTQRAGGHIQSLILASLLMMLGVLVFVCGMMADIIAANRKLLEDVQYRVRKLDYDRQKAMSVSVDAQNKTSTQ